MTLAATPWCMRRGGLYIRGTKHKRKSDVKTGWSFFTVVAKTRFYWIQQSRNKSSENLPHRLQWPCRLEWNRLPKTSAQCTDVSPPGCWWTADRRWPTWQPAETWCHLRGDCNEKESWNQSPDERFPRLNPGRYLSHFLGETPEQLRLPLVDFVQIKC